jgi:hypothetical protein
MGLCHESGGHSHFVMSVARFSPVSQEQPSNSCHGLLWIGEDMLRAHLFSQSMQNRGRNLMLVSQKDGPGTAELK